MPINADIAPTETNPHSWLPLIRDPAGSADPRVLYGVLRPSYRGGPTARMISDIPPEPVL